MRSEGFLTLRTLHALVLMCVSVCGNERSLHIVIQETHMIACDWGVRHSRRPAQTVQRGGVENSAGCKHLSATQRRQVGLEASGR